MCQRRRCSASALTPGVLHRASAPGRGCCAMSTGTDASSTSRVSAECWSWRSSAAKRGGEQYSGLPVPRRLAPACQTGRWRFVANRDSSASRRQAISDAWTSAGARSWCWPPRCGRTARASRRESDRCCVSWGSPGLVDGRSGPHLADERRPVSAGESAAGSSAARPAGAGRQQLVAQQVLQPCFALVEAPAVVAGQRGVGGR